MRWRKKIFEQRWEETEEEEVGDSSVIERKKTKIIDLEKEEIEKERKTWKFFNNNL